MNTRTSRQSTPIHAEGDGVTLLHLYPTGAQLGAKARCGFVKRTPRGSWRSARALDNCVVCQDLNDGHPTRRV
jgi:hypothetical protein